MKPCTLVLYVDDCFMDCEDPAALDYVEAKVTQKYGGCTRHDGYITPFLGVMMDLTKKRSINFTMSAFVDEIVKDSKVAT
jgi:hypothetical protein